MAETTATLSYEGHLITRLVHTRSGQTFLTDAPVDNQGKGSAFSPTDLLAASLLSCKVTTMAIGCEGRGWEVPNMRGAVHKIMASNPRRVARLEVEIHIESFDTDPHKRATLEAIGRGCPVARSLNAELEIVADYIFL